MPEACKQHAPHRPWQPSQPTHCRTSSSLKRCSDPCPESRSSAGYKVPGELIHCAAEKQEIERNRQRLIVRRSHRRQCRCREDLCSRNAVHQGPVNETQTVQSSLRKTARPAPVEKIIPICVIVYMQIVGKIDIRKWRERQPAPPPIAVISGKKRNRNGGSSSTATNHFRFVGSSVAVVSSTCTGSRNRSAGIRATTATPHEASNISLLTATGSR